MIKLKDCVVKYKKLRGFFSMGHSAEQRHGVKGVLHSRAVSRRFAFKRPAAIRNVLFIFVVLISLFAVAPTKKAQACGDYCVCEIAFHSVLRTQLVFESLATNAWIVLQFELHREIFWEEWMWGYNIGNALMMWTQELANAAMTQVFAVGAFFDAKHQLETQRLLQMKMVDAQRDYRPDTGMCTIGTVARGLGYTTRNAEDIAHTITQNNIDRFTNTRNSAAGFGPSGDKDARFLQLRQRFCDPHDGTGLMSTFVCSTPPGTTTRNKDVDFGRTVLEPLTINTDEMNDVMALASYLYAHNVPAPFADTLFQTDTGKSYALDLRSIAAKRSIATFSFGSIVGQKAEGSAASAGNAQYLRAVFRNLGLSDTEAGQLIGARPSYYAQMEMLTKKIYQQPAFYVSLYEAPANVERKGAAIQALRLTQDMDKFNSVIRSEQALSALLELHIEDIQKEVINLDGSSQER